VKTPGSRATFQAMAALPLGTALRGWARSGERDGQVDWVELPGDITVVLDANP